MKNWGGCLQDAAVGPEGNLLPAEQHHLLHQAIFRVPPTLRIVLVLHDMEELTPRRLGGFSHFSRGRFGSGFIEHV